MNINPINITATEAIEWITPLSNEMNSLDNNVIRMRCLIFEQALHQKYSGRPVKVRIDDDLKKIPVRDLMRLSNKFILHLSLIDEGFPLLGNMISELMKCIEEVVSYGKI